MAVEKKSLVTKKNHIDAPPPPPPHTKSSAPNTLHLSDFPKITFPKKTHFHQVIKSRSFDLNTSNAYLQSFGYYNICY